MNVLVIGAAKTGTTIVSKTIRNGIIDADYHMEPQDSRFFMHESVPGDRSHVVKIIFEHWDERPNLRKAIVLNELPFKFDKIIFIVRDPRDEILSRVMYFMYPWVSEHRLDGNEERVRRWIAFIRKVEQEPVLYSFQEIIEFLGKNFSSGVGLSRKTQALKLYRDFMLSVGEQVYVLKYEDFIQSEWQGLESYLGFPLSIKSDSRQQHHRTRRSSSFNNWKELFKPVDVDFFRKEWGDIMLAQGYTDWELEPVPHLSSDNYSGYLERLLDELSTDQAKPISSSLQESNLSVLQRKSKSLFGFLRN
ncbi:MAG: hypothetical protein R3E95_21300 [Thiolinea sp.]